MAAIPSRWLAQWSLRFDDPLSDAERFQINDSGIVTMIGGRASSAEEIQGQYMGLLAFAPSGWAKVETYLKACAPEVADKLDMTGLLARLIAEAVPVGGVPYEGIWGEVDSSSDLALFERLHDEGRAGFV